MAVPKQKPRRKLQQVGLRKKREKLRRLKEGAPFLENGPHLHKLAALIQKNKTIKYLTTKFFEK